MARPRQPIQLVIAKGKKHLTKAEIEQREQEELKAPVGDITPPEYLPAKLKDEFNELAGKLTKISIMSELDVDLLARYLLSKQSYLILTNKYVKEMGKDNINQLEKIATIQDKAFKQCQSAARDLGLTISSRCKLVMPHSDKGVEEDELTEMFN